MRNRKVTIGGQTLALETLLRRYIEYRDDEITNKGIETWMRKHERQIEAALAKHKTRRRTLTIGRQTLTIDTLEERLKRFNAGTLTPAGLETWMRKNVAEIRAKLKEAGNSAVV